MRLCYTKKEQEKYTHVPLMLFLGKSMKCFLSVGRINRERSLYIHLLSTFGNSPPAISRLSSGLFQEVIITNTIPLSEQNYFPQLTVLSVANLLGETIWRVHDDCSVSKQKQYFKSSFCFKIKIGSNKIYFGFLREPLSHFQRWELIE